MNSKARASAAITDAKGLYFINPSGEEKNKPTQIWTQGETEATSAWFPTIDKPNQKTTDEIIMTVPAKYVTLEWKTGQLKKKMRWHTYRLLENGSAACTLFIFYGSW